jgi:hypothetical protein
MTHPPRSYRAGESLEDFCRACKTDRLHTIIAVDAAGQPLRVACGFCRSEHNFRGGPRVEPSSPPARPSAPIRSAAVMSPSAPAAPAHEDLEMLLRRVIREEMGLTPVASADKWRGGSLVLRPGTPGLQEKSWPIDTFFHKIVMVRNRLRTLEQQVNAAALPEETKLKLQGYISGCYGTLTSFNVLFADQGDQFKGSGGD